LLLDTPVHFSYFKTEPMSISLVSKATQDTAISLLQKASLPVEDIGDRTELYALTIEGEIIGTIGLEHNGTFGLLRSLSVQEAKRGRGCGETLVLFLEEKAKEKGIQTLFLLTTTAASFFTKHGYQTISRSELPFFIQQTSEFRSTCPASATVMKKDLTSFS